MAHGGFFREQWSLSHQFRLISVDLRGHGESVRRGERPGVDRLAADIAELVDTLELESAIGVGWSLGASLLWKVLAGPAGHRFAGAVVVDMTARVRNGDGWDLGLTVDACDARTAAIEGDFRNFAQAAGQAIFAQPIAPDRQKVADWASQEFARNDAPAIASVWASLVKEDLRGVLEQIPHPTLVIHGAQSSLYGDDTAEHLVAALPNAQAIRFQSSGHAPHLEQPEMFNQILRDFADRLSRGRTTQAIDVQGEPI
jgi:pimeloyl-ACP methyl ester carboxylesterase